MHKAFSTPFSTPFRALGTFAIATAAAAVIFLAAPRPAEAAPLSTGAAITLDTATPALTEQVQYRRGWRHRRGYRRGYYRPVYRYRGPRYYGRRCWSQPRMVMTPWGWQRRFVRVCR